MNNKCKKLFNKPHKIHLKTQTFIMIFHILAIDKNKYDFDVLRITPVEEEKINEALYQIQNGLLTGHNLIVFDVKPALKPNFVLVIWCGATPLSF